MDFDFDEYRRFTADELKNIDKSFQQMIYGQGITIIVVDPSVAKRRVLVNTLKNAGFEKITEASKGAEGIEAAKKEQNKVILSLVEVDMPVMDGITYARNFFNVVPNGTVMLVCDKISRDKSAEAVSEGVSAVLQRPVDGDDLLKKLDSFGIKW